MADTNGTMTDNVSEALLTKLLNVVEIMPPALIASILLGGLILIAGLVVCVIGAIASIMIEDRKTKQQDQAHQAL